MNDTSFCAQNLTIIFPFAFNLLIHFLAIQMDTKIGDTAPLKAAEVKKGDVRSFLQKHPLFWREQFN